MQHRSSSNANPSADKSDKDKQQQQPPAQPPSQPDPKQNPTVVLMFFAAVALTMAALRRMSAVVKASALLAIACTVAAAADVGIVRHRKQQQQQKQQQLQQQRRELMETLLAAGNGSSTGAARKEQDKSPRFQFSRGAASGNDAEAGEDERVVHQSVRSILEASLIKSLSEAATVQSRIAAAKVRTRVRAEAARARRAQGDGADGSNSTVGDTDDDSLDAELDLDLDLKEVSFGTRLWRWFRAPPQGHLAVYTDVITLTVERNHSSLLALSPLASKLALSAPLDDVLLHLKHNQRQTANITDSDKSKTNNNAGSAVTGVSLPDLSSARLHFESTRPNFHLRARWHRCVPATPAALAALLPSSSVSRSLPRRRVRASLLLTVTAAALIVLALLPQGGVTVVVAAGAGVRQGLVLIRVLAMAAMAAPYYTDAVGGALASVSVAKSAQAAAANAAAALKTGSSGNAAAAHSAAAVFTVGTSADLTGAATSGSSSASASASARADNLRAAVYAAWGGSALATRLSASPTGTLWQGRFWHYERGLVFEDGLTLGGDGVYKEHDDASAAATVAATASGERDVRSKPGSTITKTKYYCVAADLPPPSQSHSSAAIVAVVNSDKCGSDCTEHESQCFSVTTAVTAASANSLSNSHGRSHSDMAVNNDSQLLVTFPASSTLRAAFTATVHLVIAAVGVAVSAITQVLAIAVAALWELVGVLTLGLSTPLVRAGVLSHNNTVVSRLTAHITAPASIGPDLSTSLHLPGVGGTTFLNVPHPLSIRIPPYTVGTGLLTVTLPPAAATAAARTAATGGLLAPAFGRTLRAIAAAAPAATMTMATRKEVVFAERHDDDDDDDIGYRVVGESGDKDYDDEESDDLPLCAHNDIDNIHDYYSDGNWDAGSTTIFSEPSFALNARFLIAASPAPLRAVLTATAAVSALAGVPLTPAPVDGTATIVTVTGGAGAEGAGPGAAARAGWDAEAEVEAEALAEARVAGSWCAAPVGSGRARAGVTLPRWMQQQQQQHQQQRQQRQREHHYEQQHQMSEFEFELEQQQRQHRHRQRRHRQRTNRTQYGDIGHDRKTHHHASFSSGSDHGKTHLSTVSWLRSKWGISALTLASVAGGYTTTTASHRGLTSLLQSGGLPSNSAHSYGHGQRTKCWDANARRVRYSVSAHAHGHAHGHAAHRRRHRYECHSMAHRLSALAGGLNTRGIDWSLEAAYIIPLDSAPIPRSQAPPEAATTVASSVAAAAGDGHFTYSLINSHSYSHAQAYLDGDSARTRYSHAQSQSPLPLPLRSPSPPPRMLMSSPLTGVFDLAAVPAISVVRSPAIPGSGVLPRPRRAGPRPADSSSDKDAARAHGRSHAHIGGGHRKESSTTVMTVAGSEMIYQVFIGPIPLCVSVPVQLPTKRRQQSRRITGRATHNNVSNDTSAMNDDNDDGYTRESQADDDDDDNVDEDDNEEEEVATNTCGGLGASMTQQARARRLLTWTTLNFITSLSTIPFTRPHENRIDTHHGAHGNTTSSRRQFFRSVHKSSTDHSNAKRTASAAAATGDNDDDDADDDDEEDDDANEFAARAGVVGTAPLTGLAAVAEPLTGMHIGLAVRPSTIVVPAAKQQQGGAHGEHDATGAASSTASASASAADSSASAAEFNSNAEHFRHQQQHGEQSPLVFVPYDYPAMLDLLTRAGNALLLSPRWPAPVTSHSASSDPSRTVPAHFHREAQSSSADTSGHEGTHREEWWDDVASITRSVLSPLSYRCWGGTFAVDDSTWAWELPSIRSYFPSDVPSAAAAANDAHPHSSHGDAHSHSAHSHHSASTHPPNHARSPSASSAAAHSRSANAAAAAAAARNRASGAREGRWAPEVVAQGCGMWAALTRVLMGKAALIEIERAVFITSPNPSTHYLTHNKRKKGMNDKTQSQSQPQAQSQSQSRISQNATTTTTTTEVHYSQYQFVGSYLHSTVRAASVAVTRSLRRALLSIASVYSALLPIIPGLPITHIAGSLSHTVAQESLLALVRGAAVAAAAVGKGGAALLMALRRLALKSAVAGKRAAKRSLHVATALSNAAARVASEVAAVHNDCEQQRTQSATEANVAAAMGKVVLCWARAVKHKAGLAYARVFRKLSNFSDAHASQGNDDGKTNSSHGTGANVKSSRSDTVASTAAAAAAAEAEAAVVLASAVSEIRSASAPFVGTIAPGPMGIIQTVVLTLGMVSGGIVGTAMVVILPLYALFQFMYVLNLSPQS